MAVGGDLEPVLSIYFTPGNQAYATVSVVLSSGNVVRVTEKGTERKTFKFSELGLTYSISILFDAASGYVTTKNLTSKPSKTRAPATGRMTLWIEDVTQSASIVVE